MFTLNKLNMINRFLSYLSLDYPSVAVFVPFIPKNNLTIYELLPKLNLIRTNFRNVFISQHKKTVKGVRIDTEKVFNELKTFSTNKWIRTFPLIKNIPEKLRSNVVVDLFPIYNQMTPLFERFKSNPELYFGYWLETFLSEISNIKKKLDDNTKIIPIVVFNIENEDDLKTFNTFYSYLERNSFKIETLIQSNLNFAIPYINKPIYG